MSNNFYSSKSTVVVDGDIVIKHLKSITDTSAEAESIIKLSNFYSEPSFIDGWCFDVVRLVRSPIGKSLFLKKAHGSAVSYYFFNSDKGLLATEKMGQWLAHFHNKSNDTSGRVFSFGDFTIHNLILDFDSASVTAIDPGIWGCTYQDRERDFLCGAISIAFFCWKNYRSEIPFLKSFIYGYRGVSKSRLDKLHLSRNIKEMELFGRSRKNHLKIRSLALRFAVKRLIRLL